MEDVEPAPPLTWFRLLATCPAQYFNSVGENDARIKYAAMVRRIN